MAKLRVKFLNEGKIVGSGEEEIPDGWEISLSSRAQSWDELEVHIESPRDMRKVFFGIPEAARECDAWEFYIDGKKVPR